MSATAAAAPAAAAPAKATKKAAPKKKASSASAAAKPNIKNMVIAVLKAESDKKSGISHQKVVKKVCQQAGNVEADFCKRVRRALKKLFETGKVKNVKGVGIAGSIKLNVAVRNYYFNFE